MNDIILSSRFGQRARVTRTVALDDPLRGPILGLAPHWAEIVGTVLLLVFYAIAAGDGYATVGITNILGPIFFTIIVAMATLRMTRDNPHAVWTPLFWYRATMVLYLGLGTSLTSFFNADTRDLLQIFHAFSPGELLTFNIVNAIFHVTVIITSWIIIKISRLHRAKGRGSILSIEACHVSPHMIGMTFLTIGLATNYLIVYPSILGVYHFQLPNFLAQVGQAAYIGYFLITYWGLTHKKYRWVTAMIVLAIIDSAAGLLQLSKMAALFPILMIPIAFLYHKSSFRRIVLTLAILVPCYSFIATTVYSARDRVERRGAGGSAQVSDAIAVLKDSSAGSDQAQSQFQYQLNWVRFNYVSAGTFAISQYNQGLPGDSLRDVFVVWIPRAIYKDKPIITDIAREFTFLANGNYDSSSSPTIPSEGYWDYGYGGVLLFALLLGTILSLWSIYSTVALARGAWHLLLVALLGMRVGTRIDGMLVPDVVGPLSAILVIHLACQMANRFLPRIAYLRGRAA